MKKNKNEIVPKLNYDFKDLMILSLWKRLSINQIESANNSAISQTSNRNQKSKIRWYYKKIMNGKMKRFNELNCVELSKQIDKFLRVDPTSGHDE